MQTLVFEDSIGLYNEGIFSKSQSKSLMQRALDFYFVI